MKTVKFEKVEVNGQLSVEASVEKAKASFEVALAEFRTELETKLAVKAAKATVPEAWLGVAGKVEQFFQTHVGNASLDLLTSWVGGEIGVKFDQFVELKAHVSACVKANDKLESVKGRNGGIHLKK